MESYRGLTIASLISSLCILSGAGHGILPMCIAEVLVVIRPGKVFFNGSDNYENSTFIFIAAAILLLGQAWLFFATVKRKLIGRLIALILLWVGLFYLVHNIFTGDSLAGFSFITGIPFLLISGTLFVLDVKQYLQLKKQLQQQ